MLVCDRCGKKITFANNSTNKVLMLYNRKACYISQNVDLCKDCIIEYEEVMRRAESYFMVNKDKPSEVFDCVKYWTD